MTDEELMLAYQRGDEIAFGELYRRYAGRLYGFLLRRATDRASADDLFQTAFTKLHQFRHRYDSAFPFAPWLFTIARNVWVDHARLQRGRAEDPLREEEIAAPAAHEPMQTPSLAALSLAQQSAIRLRYRDDFSFEEISKRLQTTPANVRQMISRGLRRLRGKS